MLKWSGNGYIGSSSGTSHGTYSKGKTRSDLQLIVWIILFGLSIFIISGLIAFHQLDETFDRSNIIVKNLILQTKLKPPNEFIPTHAAAPSHDSKGNASTGAAGLNYLKTIGRSDTITNPITKRQQLSAFSSDFNSSRYERIDCPEYPEPGYPKTYPMKYLLDNWNPDDTTIPPFHFNSLCYFDYNTEKQKAFNYRDAEVPFIVYNVPEIEEVVERWSDLEYLQTKIGHGRLPTETSLDNHFMYYVPPDEKDRSEITDSKGNPWVEPTKEVLMSYSKWLEMAVFNHFKPLEKRKHAYFRVSADDQSHWLFQELPFFQPKESLFMVDPTEQAGIHCRFGMNSIISESHFDASRNYAITFSGVRRWILNHPNQCRNLYMYPTGHPSERHSQIDWSQPNYFQYPNFAFAESNEVIVRPGDALYLPTNWLHYIVSLNVNLQCNSRSGYTEQFDRMVHEDCGLE